MTFVIRRQGDQTNIPIESWLQVQTRQLLWAYPNYERASFRTIIVGEPRVGIGPARLE